MRSDITRSESLASLILRYIRKFHEEIRRKFGRDFTIRIMDFCGTHEWTIVHYGIRTILPEDIELVAGPGCPVCVTPSTYVEYAIRLALDGIVVYTYGDVYRLPSLRPIRGVRTLAEAKAQGADVRVVQGFAQAILDSRRHRRDSIFVGIGFETAAPGYAEALVSGLLSENLKFMSLVKLTPPIAIHVVESSFKEDEPIMGVIAPGHVSAVVGGQAWVPLAESLGVPTVVAGFEPNDVLLAIAEILRQLAKDEAKVVVEYSRVVKWEGNQAALRLINRAFKVVDSTWRGIGRVSRSGLLPRDEYEKYDAFTYFGLRYDVEADEHMPRGCKCGEVIVGKARPTDCPLFLRTCTPERPYGPCMVSIEGTCAIWARYGGHIVKDLIKELGLE